MKEDEEKERKSQGGHDTPTRKQLQGNLCKKRNEVKIWKGGGGEDGTETNESLRENHNEVHHGISLPSHSPRFRFCIFYLVYENKKRRKEEK
jgi:hypothetical protein